MKRKMCLQSYNPTCQGGNDAVYRVKESQKRELGWGLMKSLIWICPIKVSAE